MKKEKEQSHQKDAVININEDDLEEGPFALYDAVAEYRKAHPEKPIEPTFTRTEVISIVEAVLERANSQIFYRWVEANNDSIDATEIRVLIESTPYLDLLKKGEVQ